MGITMGKLKPSAPPYTGPAVHYQFVNMQVTIGQQMTFNTTPIPVVTSNAETYYPALASWYVDGFKLLAFYRIPGQMGQAGLFNMASNITFQGIMCRYSDMPDRGRWQLCIEKSVVQVQALNAGIVSMQHGVQSDTSHILQTIALKTQGGGRLLCIGMTGQQGQNLGMAMSGLAPPMGVDLFFEIPSEPIPEQYVYTSVSVPINARFQLAGIHRTELAANCDWKGNLANNLSQGWRLVEIFMDMSMHINSARHRSMITYNSLWFFEKPASRANDPTPMYEGRVILHDIRTSTGIVGAPNSASWEPVIHDMGNDGWELACIVETPDSQMPGMGTMIQKCVLFFQRPLFTPAASQFQTVHDGDATSGKGYGR